MHGDAIQLRRIVLGGLADNFVQNILKHDFPSRRPSRPPRPADPGRHIRSRMADGQAGQPHEVWLWQRVTEINLENLLEGIGVGQANFDFRVQAAGSFERRVKIAGVIRGADDDHALTGPVPSNSSSSTLMMLRHHSPCLESFSRLPMVSSSSMNRIDGAGRAPGGGVGGVGKDQSDEQQFRRQPIVAAHRQRIVEKQHHASDHCYRQARIHPGQGKPRQRLERQLRRAAAQPQIQHCDHGLLQQAKSV